MRTAHRLHSTVVTVAVLCAVIGPRHVATSGTEPQTIILPLRLTAMAAGTGAVTPGATGKLEIDITRWSSTSEREALVAILNQAGPDGLLPALQQMPFHGHMSIPRWVGPDPYQARLGWDLRYATFTSLDGEALRIVLATDRVVGFWETRESSKAVEYPFTLVDIRLDKNKRGTGKMSVAAKIAIDRTTGDLQIENYASQPVRLTEVKIDR